MLVPEDADREGSGALNCNETDLGQVQVAVEPNAPVGEPVAVPAHAREAEPEDLTGTLEALCFTLNRPLSLLEAGAVLGRSARDVDRIAGVLRQELRGRGLMLQRHQDQLQLVTRPEVAWAVQRALNPEKPSRLSRAALETLAIVAYRQPVTRASIESIRGVHCDAVLENLERRALVTEVGRADTPGRPRLFGTTLRFLQILGLERIQELPPLPAGMVVPELTDLGDIEIEPASPDSRP